MICDCLALLRCCKVCFADNAFFVEILAHPPKAYRLSDAEFCKCLGVTLSSGRKVLKFVCFHEIRTKCQHKRCFIIASVDTKCCLALRCCSQRLAHAHPRSAHRKHRAANAQFTRDNIHDTHVAAMGIHNDDFATPRPCNTLANLGPGTDCSFC